MKYSYDRTKTASFQDRVKGSFEAIVWINDFASMKSRQPTLMLNGTLSLLVGGDSGDDQFRSAIVSKKGAKWALISDTGNPLVDVLLGALVAKGVKLPAELDRIYNLINKR